MKSLTKAEEEVMRKLWKLKEAFLREIVNEMPDPKPHQNTVATLLKILVEKKYVGIEPFGRMHRYHPLVKQSDYSKGRVKNIMKKYFDNSFANVVSAMVKDKDVSVAELELLLKEIKKEQK